MQANAFAAEFLVPRVGVTGRVDGEPTLEDVVRLAALYGVSAPMMLVRFRQVRIGSAERLARLQREVDAGEHVTLFDILGLEPIDDALAADRAAALPLAARCVARCSMRSCMATRRPRPSSRVRWTGIMRPGRR